jgi:tRNA (cmo5U34)-methyltransferase
VSALAIHHVDGPAKADLFRRAAAVVGPGGRLVVADVVIPENPADAVTPLEPCVSSAPMLDNARYVD